MLNKWSLHEQILPIRRGPQHGSDTVRTEGERGIFWHLEASAWKALDRSALEDVVIRAPTRTAPSPQQVTTNCLAWSVQDYSFPQDFQKHLKEGTLCGSEVYLVSRAPCLWVSYISVSDTCWLLTFLMALRCQWSIQLHLDLLSASAFLPELHPPAGSQAEHAL